VTAVMEAKGARAQAGHLTTVEFIDMTPTWGEWGRIYARMAESGEGAAVRHLRPDFDKAMASCQALKALAGTLTDEQMALVARVMANELAKLRQ
jgi:hypothetical protein